MHVRRVAPLPEVDLLEAQERTVVAENLPEAATIASLEVFFGVVGPVKMIRICQPGDVKATTQTVQGSSTVVSDVISHSSRKEPLGPLFPEGAPWLYAVTHPPDC